MERGARCLIPIESTDAAERTRYRTSTEFAPEPSGSGGQCLHCRPDTSLWEWAVDRFSYDAGSDSALRHRQSVGISRQTQREWFDDGILQLLGNRFRWRQ